MANETKSSGEYTPTPGSKDSAVNPVRQHDTPESARAASGGRAQHSTDRTTEQQAPHPPTDTPLPADPRMTHEVMDEETWNETLEHGGITPHAAEEAKNREAWDKQEQERLEHERQMHEQERQAREHK